MNDNKAFVYFIVASCSMIAVIVGIQAYSEGESKQLEIQLKIEQEKTKQLKYERDSTNTER